MVNFSIYFFVYLQRILSTLWCTVLCVSVMSNLFVILFIASLFCQLGNCVKISLWLWICLFIFSFVSVCGFSFFQVLLKYNWHTAVYWYSLFYCTLLFCALQMYTMKVCGNPVISDDGLHFVTIKYFKLSIYIIFLDNAIAHLIGVI